MFLTVEEAIEHIQSGNARIMLKSNVTQNQYKYWVKENNNGKAFLVYLISTEGQLAYMGSISNGDFKRTDKSKVSERAPAFVAFSWLWAQLSRYRLPPDIEIVPLEQQEHGS